MKKQIFTKVCLTLGIITSAICILLFPVGCSKDAKPTTPVDKVPQGIVYTYVGADSVIIDSSRQVYGLDLDKDGNNDISFVTSGNSCDGVMGPLVTELSLSVLGYSTSIDSIYYESVLDSASKIDSGARWANNQFLLRGAVNSGYIRCMISSGLWFHIVDKYLGVKFTKGNDTFYGWLRLSSSYGFISERGHGSKVIIGQIKLKDYAYNSAPNQPILAGQMK